jgi:serine/threonine protein phosphatase PrpC
MKTDITSFSLAGRKKLNQDSLLTMKRSSLTVLAVADGMGGHSAGEVASDICISMVKQYFEKGDLPELTSDTFNECFERIAHGLKLFAENAPESVDLGTTLSLAIICENEIHVAHVGDSRIYLLRGNGIKAITKDQTEVQHLLDQKIINKVQARRYKRKNVLLSVLNAKHDFEIEYGVHSLQSEDRVVLMTDGCYANISKKEIRDLSIKIDSVEQLKDRVLTLVQSREIRDDYSAIFYHHQ